MKNQWWRIAPTALLALWAAVFPSSVGAQTPVVYVPNADSDTISIIDIRSNVVSDTIPLIGGPVAVVAAGDGRRAYVSLSDSSSIAVLDTQKNQLVATIPVGNDPVGLVLSPDDSLLYVANFFSNTVSVIATSSNSVVDEITVGTGPSSVAVSPGGRRLYVANSFSSNLSAIDTSTAQVVNIIDFTNGIPSDIAVSADGSRIYVTRFGLPEFGLDDGVSVLGGTGTLVANISGVGPGAGQVELRPDGRFAYIANFLSGLSPAGNAMPPGTVSVIDTRTNQLTGSIPVGVQPGGIAFTPDSSRAYVTNAGTASTPGTVSVIDTLSDTVIATITVGFFPTIPAIFSIPPETVLFSSFKAKLKVKKDEFKLDATFALGTGSDGIDPVAEEVSLEIGAFSLVVPPGSFRLKERGEFGFEGFPDGTELEIEIRQGRGGSSRIKVEAEDVSLPAIGELANVGLRIGDDSGSTMARVKKHD
ncbi:MAG: hypothetical protein ACE5HV_01740 [Acidobacteriota bacterium]